MACVLCALGSALADGTEAQTPASQEGCASCGFRAPDQSERVDVDFLEAVKRHILNRLQMRERPNITHPIPKAAMVTALRRLHAGKVRADGRVEIPNFDGQAAYNNEIQEESSEIISFAESGNYERFYRSHRSRIDPPLNRCVRRGSPQSPKKKKNHQRHAYIFNYAPPTRGVHFVHQHHLIILMQSSSFEWRSISTASLVHIASHH